MAVYLKGGRGSSFISLLQVPLDGGPALVKNVNEAREVFSRTRALASSGGGVPRETDLRAVDAGKKPFQGASGEGRKSSSAHFASEFGADFITSLITLQLWDF